MFPLQNPSNWISLAEPSSERNTSVSSTEPVPPNVSHDEAAHSDLSTEEIMIFQNECIGRALQSSTKVQHYIRSISEAHHVHVLLDLSRATISGNAEGVSYVLREISTLTLQVKRHITAHCVLTPILFSSQGRQLIHSLQQKYVVDISLIDIHARFHLANSFVEAFYSQRQLLQKAQVKDFLFPIDPAHTHCNWAFTRNSQQQPLPGFVNQLLSSRYCQNSIGEEIFQIDGIAYRADLSAMILTDTRSGETETLNKVPQEVIWRHYLQDQTNAQLVDCFPHHSSSLETMYRYGGSSVTLSGTRHLVDFFSMSEANLDTGKATTISRFPAPQSNLLPDYNCHLVLSGPPETLDEAARVITHELDSLCVPSTLTVNLSGISQHWQEIIAIISLNILRQYCIKVAEFNLHNEVLTVQLRGERDYNENVKVHVKEQLLDLRSYVMTRERNVQAARPIQNLPPEWEHQVSDIEFKPVRKGSQEWRDIERMVHATLSTARVLTIDRVQNRQLWEKYALEKSHMFTRNNGIINEKHLFHGTRKSDPQSVARSLRGIDFRFSRRDHQLLWGTGAYFAVNASYSDRYRYESHSVRKLIVAKVLTGHSIRYREPSPQLTRPPPLHAGSNLLYDTVNGRGGGSDIYVVYDQDRAYPAYILSYTV